MSVQTAVGTPKCNIPHDRGDTFDWILKFFSSPGVAQDITGWTIFFTAKTSLDDGDASAKLSVNVTSHSNAVGGISRLTIAAATMAGLGYGEYPYDIQVKKADGTIQTFLKGKLIIEKDSTIRTT